MRLVIAAALLLAAPTPAAGVSAAAGQIVTITMRDFSYTPDQITVQAGTPVVLTLINKGKVTHEFMIYDVPKSASTTMVRAWAERTNYFSGMKVETSGGKVTRMAGDFVGLKLAVGKTATLKFTPVTKGTFEMGCMIEGHYQAGQQGVLIVK